jgi:hypothetical protein
MYEILSFKECRNVISNMHVVLLIFCVFFSEEKCEFGYGAWISVSSAVVTFLSGLVLGCSPIIIDGGWKSNIKNRSKRNDQYDNSIITDPSIDDPETPGMNPLQSMNVWANNVQNQCQEQCEDNCKPETCGAIQRCSDEMGGLVGQELQTTQQSCGRNVQESTEEIQQVFSFEEEGLEEDQQKVLVRVIRTMKLAQQH